MKSQIRTSEDIKKLGSILSIWAHPDDESFTAAGIMAVAIKNGQQVACLTATKGEAGVQDESRWPADKLGELRAQEMYKALEILGCRNHHWLNYYDGQCHKADANEAVEKIIMYINKYNPDTILTFGPDGMTGHSDHQTVSAWVSQATLSSDIKVYHAVEEEERFVNYMVEADKKFNIYFNIDKPPVHKAENCDINFILPEEIISQKRSALKSMPSQTEVMFNNTPAETMDAMLAQENFVLRS